MLFRRIIAQLIDIFLALTVIVLSTTMVLPKLSDVIPIDVAAVLVLLLCIGACILLQYPFMKVNQTAGKAFVGLEIRSTDEEHPNMTMGRFFQREILCKLLSCYLICLPAFIGKVGGQDIASHTEVVKVKAKVRKQAK